MRQGVKGELAVCLKSGKAKAGENRLKIEFEPYDLFDPSPLSNKQQSSVNSQFED